MRALALLAASMAVAGCLQDPATPPTAEPIGPVPTEFGEPIRFRTLLHSTHAPLFEEDTRTELSPASWNETWDRYAASVLPRPARPAVDHETERIYLVTSGMQRSGCHDIRVANVSVTQTTVYVWADVWDGERESAVCTDQVLWPTHIVAVQTNATNAHFMSRTMPDRFVHIAPEPGSSLPEPLSARPLARGSFSGIHEDTRRLIRDAAAWEALWREHTSREPLPEVFFPNESVVAVVVPGPTGCAGFHLGAITYDSAARVLDVPVVFERQDPQVQCFVAFENLYEFVAIPDRAGDARFRDVEWHEEETPAGPYRFRTLAKGADSAIEANERRVITSAREWAAFWAEHRPARDAPPPQVDFHTERVLTVVGPTRSADCWEVEVQEIHVGESNVLVTVRGIPPSPDESCDGRRPYHFVTYPITPLEPVFREGP